MVNYHISPKTGRSNICRAQDGACPLKSSDEEKLRLANSRMGKYGSTEVTVKDDRIDWVNDSTMGNNYRESLRKYLGLQPR